ncbi:Vacuolar protein sorting-associated protein 62 [Spatholobus suberectus]|nr:Vacuolar protein sorting-associated protein 62 [Spatholobus suberectus]
MGVNVGIVCAALLLATQAIGVPATAPWKKPFEGNIFHRKQALPIDTIFKLPVTNSSWPPGGNFASGIIDLGGLQVSQISTFNKIWGTYGGGYDDQGITMFEPSGIPQGFFTLASYSQPNNKPLYGWVLVAKDVSKNTSNPSLKQPVDYTLVWNSASLQINQDGPVYVWLPTAPDGYKAVGHVVTTTADKPSLDKIRCVRADLTDQCETTSLIWGSDSFNVYYVRPSNRGIQGPGVRVGSGTFVAQNGNPNPPSIACLKNTNAIPKYMPNLQQIKAILRVYSPTMCLHPDEEYFPSSVDWFFSNGALLYKKGQESSPVPIASNFSNLPQDPNDDGAYWLDLPADEANKERVKRGDLPSAVSYVHVKPMLGGTFTDIAIWVFYPFNGPARAKVEFINLKLGKIGEHIGDWEHVTLRVSNFNGELKQVYFSQHSKGIWLDSSQIEFQNGNKPLYYSSLHGHASYPHAGLTMLGGDKIGIRDDTAKGDNVMDMGAFQLVAAEYLGSDVVEPLWLNYFRGWGPKIDYDVDDELNKLVEFMPGKLKSSLEKIVSSLPPEMLGEEGPTGPKNKNNWNRDEV